MRYCKIIRKTHVVVSMNKLRPLIHQKRFIGPGLGLNQRAVERDGKKPRGRGQKG